MSVQVPKGYQQTEVGVIPEDWEIKEIGNIGKLLKGKGLLKNEINDFGNIPAIPYTAIYTDFNEILDYKKINSFTNKVEKTILIDEPSVIIASSSNMDKNTGKATALTKSIPVAVGREVIIFVSQQNPAFISYLLSTNIYRKKTLILARGTTIKHVYPETFRNYKICVPSKKEQDLISEAVLDADTLIESLEQLIAKKRQIKQGAMQELLTGQRRLPRFSGEWRKETIKNIVQTPVTDGPHMTPLFLNDGIPFLSVNNLVDGLIDFGDLRYISQADHEEFSRKCKPQKGDILLGKAASVGKVAIVETDVEFNIWSPIALIRLNNKNHGKYIYYQLQSDEVNKQISLLTNTSSQGNIGMGDIEKIVIPTPDKDEQIAIAEILTTLDAEIEELKIRVRKALKIKQSMMQELLTGRIRLI